MPTNYKKVFAIQKKNEELMLKVNPNLNHKPGIYFLTRTDSLGVRHAYVGLAHDVLKRLGQHLSTYQYVDNSIRKWGLYCEENPHGYKVNFLNFPEDQLEEKERYYITQYSLNGYQMKNRDTGGGAGKQELGERKSPKTYRQGIQQGKRMLARELSDIAGKHLVISLKPEKQNNKTSRKMFEKFQSLMDETNYE